MYLTDFLDTYHSIVKWTPNYAWDPQFPESILPKTSPEREQTIQVNKALHWKELNARNKAGAAYLKQRHERKFGRAAKAAIGDEVIFIHPRLSISRYWSKSVKKMDGRGQIVRLSGDFYAIVSVKQIPEFYEKSWKEGLVKVHLRTLHKTGYSDLARSEELDLSSVEEMIAEDFPLTGELEDLEGDEGSKFCCKISNKSDSMPTDFQLSDSNIQVVDEVVNEIEQQEEDSFSDDGQTLASLLDDSDGGQTLASLLDDSDDEQTLASLVNGIISFTTFNK